VANVHPEVAKWFVHKWRNGLFEDGES